MNTSTSGNEREALLREIIRQLMAVVSLGIDMRRCQRLYFRAKFGSAEKETALEMSKAAERAFDAAAAKAVAPDLGLGGGDGG